TVDRQSSFYSVSSTQLIGSNISNMKLYFGTLFSLLGLSFASPVPSPALGNREVGLVERETPLNAFLTILLDDLPPVDGTISDVAGVLTAFENLLVDVTGEQDTYNELGQACTEYTVIFARGTTEPGNVGILVGPPFFEALESLVGSSALTIQGVNDYSASIDGYIEGGDPAGSAEMAKQIEQAYAQCPSTKLVASGYSQGGQIVHNAAALLPTAVANWISSVVIFGDPDSSKAVTGVAASKTDIICHSGDNICVNGDLVLPAHLTYAINAAAAASFVVAH
ncbi:Cutin hydrolase, partial [Hyphodiscus hymeniophilus]